MDPWKRQFIRDLFPYSASRVQMERAFLAKHPHIPTSLYKYREFSSNHIDALKKNVLWMSSPDRFNDPYDTTIHFDPNRFLVEDQSLEEFMASLEELERNAKAAAAWQPRNIVRPVRSGDWRRKISEDMLKSYPVSERDQISEVLGGLLKKQHNDMIMAMGVFFRNNYSVLSLSESYSSVLMWSHYSNSHKGFVIEYDFSKLGYHDLRKRLCFPVFYTRKPRDATRYMALTNVSEFNIFFGQLMCLIKKDEWTYEREWRIVHAIGAPYANSELRMPKPSAVLLGTDVSSNDESMMRDMCRMRAIPLKKMVRQSSTYDLGAVDLPI